MGQVGLTLTPGEQLELWKAFDQNLDGLVSWDEFVRMGAVLLEQKAKQPTTHPTVLPPLEEQGWQKAGKARRRRSIAARALGASNTTSTPSKAAAGRPTAAAKAAVATPTNGGAFARRTAAEEQRLCRATEAARRRGLSAMQRPITWLKGI